MKTRKHLSIYLFCFLLSALGVNAQKQTYLDNAKTLEERVKDALSKMTLEEKVAMCHAQSKFSSKGVPRLGIPEVWTDDGPHGIREEVFWDEWQGAKWTNDSCTAFPALTCLAATFNPEMALIYGQSIGEEARYRNKTVLLGPGVNIYRTPINGRNFEYMGEDPYLSSQMVAPYIQGVQQNGVAACVKHFALNNQENNRMSINVQLSDRALHEIYLPAFKAAVEIGKVWSIMGSYNQFRGEHCCHNDLLLNKILKGDWKFDGVVISDWGGVHNSDQAVNNGLDLEMGTSTDGLTSKGKLAYSDYYLANPYLKGLKSGNYEMKTLDDKVSRILRMIFRTTMSANRPFGRFVCPEHSAAARQIAEEGIVLLKNNKQLLPLPVGKYKKIVVIGENATKSLTIGGGSSSLKVSYEVSPLEGIISKYGKENIVYSQGYASGTPNYSKEIKPNVNTDSLQSIAIETARNADIVIFIGGLNKNKNQDCEGGDRLSYNLPFNQDQLIQEILKVNKNMILVLASGNAVAMPWINDVSTIVQSWYLGSESGNAIAAVLSGEVNPSGKLPFSFPVKLEDNASMSYGETSYPGVGNNEEYKEDILVGYRWFDTKKIKPLFSFGYGLSYTTFEYSNVKTDKAKYTENEIVKLKFSLKNSGKVKGEEVAQVYISDVKSTILRPLKELKAFSKVMLEPDESKQIENSNPLTNVIMVDPIWVEFPISETYLADVMKTRQVLPTRKNGKVAGNGVIVKAILSNGEEYPILGNIDYISNKIDPLTGTIQMRAVFRNPEEKLVPGGYVTVKLESVKKNHSLLIFQSSMLVDQLGTFVYTVSKDKIVQKKYIKKGAAIDTQIVVEDGLEEGDLVIVGGVLRVRPDLKVNCTLANKNINF